MSITRRAFVRGALSGACALPGWLPSLASACCTRLNIDRVIFDARRSPALSFAATAQRLGAATQAICEDVSVRWLEDLRIRWLTPPRAVAGITDFRSLFLLQAMAADAGLHPVLRIHHGMHGAAVAHETFGARAHRTMVDAHLAASGENWAGAAARLVVCLPSRVAPTPSQACNLGEANLRALGSRALVTWVLA